MYKRVSILYIIFLATLLIFSLSITHSQTKKQDVCVSCHSQLEGNQKAPADLFKKSVHINVGVTCVDCHGGNPNNEEFAMESKAGFKGKIKPKDVPELCARCHADISKMRQYNIRTDQFAEYKTSIHGKRLFEKGDSNVATCVSCHGNHEIRKKSDPLATVYHTKVPETCAKCHADKKLMDNYKIPSTQFDEYKNSFHGQILYGKIKGKNPLLVPNCADCHGIHGATPPGVKEVVNVCGNCHSAVANYFKESPHFIAVQKVGMPRCVDCHGNHNNKFPFPEMLIGKDTGQCGSCHDEKSSQYQRAQEIYKITGSSSKIIEMGEADFKTIEKSGRNVDDLRAIFDTAQKKLLEISPATHTLNIQKIKTLSQEAETEITKVVREAEKVRRDLRIRRYAFIVVTLIVFTIVGLIYLKRESEKKRILK